MLPNFIAINRSLLDWPYANRPDYLAVWIHLLLRANYTPSKAIFNGQVVTINPGQALLSYSKFSVVCGVKRTTLDRILKRFQVEQQVERLPGVTSTLVTITNWHKFQSEWNGSGTTPEREWDGGGTVAERERNHHKNLRPEEGQEGKNSEKTPIAPTGAVSATGEQQGEHIPTPAPKPTAYPADFTEFWDAYPADRHIGKRDALKAWQKATKRATPAEIIAGVFTSPRMQRETRFIPQPATCQKSFNPGCHPRTGE